mgnify:CR=1 FL=1
MKKNKTYLQGELLRGINSPDELRKLKPKQLEQVCKEIRQYIIDIVSEKGGHFGASLGVVELTVALHYIFETPKDQLVWDVGHQAYGHKILTGRKNQFATNRIKNGLSGFPKRTESVYDTFGVGHASTSISAALGMAVASKSKGEDKQHIAVIGDGSMTAGLAFEGLNHAGAENTNILVILNDNCMSIDPAVGALKEYLTDISTSKTYNRARNKIWKILGKISRFGPNPQYIAKKIEGAVKSTILGESNYFESLNFRYFGPINGHDVEHLSVQGFHEEASCSRGAQAGWKGEPIQHLCRVMLNACEVSAHVPEDVSGHGQLCCCESTRGGHLVDESARRGGRCEVVIDNRDVELVGVNRHSTALPVLPFNQSLLHSVGR